MVPLLGLRVLELAGILAGPAVGSFFAELGADVVKIENPVTGGDPTRGWRLAGETSPEGLSAYFCSVNWGKRSLALDFTTQRPLLDRLLERADVALVNFRPGSGIDPAGLVREHPRLVVGSVTGYGPTDPRPGFDALIQAESGFMELTGPPGGPACKLPVALLDLLAAHQLKEGLLLALLQREKTGQGALVQVSLWETALASLANVATNVLMAGWEPCRLGSEHPNLYPYGTLLRCSDGAVLLAVGTDRQFSALCTALERPDLSRLYATNRLRVEGRELLRSELEAACSNVSSQTLLGRLQEAQVPAGRVQNVRQALESPAAQALLLEDGPLRGLRSLVFSGVEQVRLAAPPVLGAHSQEVVAQWLQGTFSSEGSPAGSSSSTSPGASRCPQKGQ